MVLTFYLATPGASEFSERATTDRGWVSGNTRLEDTKFGWYIY